MLGELAKQLEDAVSGDVHFDEFTRGIYATDASIYQIWPVGVIAPRDKDDVVAVVRIAREHGISIVPRGGGTSLSGQSVGPSLILDFSKYMNRVLEIDPARGLVRVQPGVVLQQLNNALKPHRLEFGPDVSTVSRATIGGMIGNNSAGSHSLIHGKTIDHVRELEVILSNGDELRTAPLSFEALQSRGAEEGLVGEIHRIFPGIIETYRWDISARFPRIIRRVSGYNLDTFVPEVMAGFPQAPFPEKLDREFPDRAQFNLSRLIVGAEGTLGIVTEAVLHAVPLPSNRGIVCLQWTDTDSALESVGKILECRPSAVELIDKRIVEMSRENLDYRHLLDFVEGPAPDLLIVEFYCTNREQIGDQFQLLEQKLTGSRGLQKLIRAETPEMCDRIWRCREAGAPLLLSIPGARKPIAFVEDPAVTPSRMPEFAKRFRQLLNGHGADGAFYGHASVGCLHIRPMIDTKSAEDLDRLEKISRGVAALVKEFKGSMSGEHGDGLSRSYLNEELFGPNIYRAFQEVKKLFDPRGIFNPEKIVGTPSPVANLRYGTSYQPLPIVTTLDFSREGHHAGIPESGFLAAAEMCNGSGVCRKTHTGTMCPSFMATGEEEHSPRGRANALRLALSGQLPEGSLTSQRMYEVMDLCLLCKGCKAECPSNVDVAKLKVEFLGQYYQDHRPSLGTTIQANAAWVHRIGATFAPITNWLVRMPGVALLTEKLLGIDHRRSVPEFHRVHFARWFRKHKPDPKAGTSGDVVLLDDCLTNFCEPNIPKAAVQLLETAGFRVHLAGLWCCGRPLFSKGFLDAGRRLARRNVTILSEYVRKGWPILGVEPSCLLSLVDEYPDLFPSSKTKLVQKNSYLIMDWFEKIRSGTSGSASAVASGGRKPPVSSNDETLAKPVAPKFITRDGSDRLWELNPIEAKALLHGHCQQKALVGLKNTVSFLEQIPGLSVQTVDSGCCGMAGSFGYEHFDLSQKIGERILLPAVRNHASGPVIAPGFSCRHQILDATGIHPLHPVELVAKQLRGTDQV